MSESTTRPATGIEEQEVEEVDEVQASINRPDLLPNTSPLVTSSPIIWTPRFIVIFALVLVTGLSTQSLLTQVWSNRYLSSEPILLTQTLLILVGWLVAIIFTRSWWIRLAGIFGSCWAIFSGISLVVAQLASEAREPLVAPLNAATNCALLGCYICLSINRTPSYRWDRWFFRLAPFIGAAIVASRYVMLLHKAHLAGALESTTALVALLLCLCTWWLRPSCWKTQPGPTFLLGLAPVILLLLAIPNAATPTSNMFYSQVILLCLLLGIMRTIQGEWRQSSQSSLQSINIPQPPHAII
jgi:hypothetical protein